MTDFEIAASPLPQRGERLFAPALDWQHNACLGWMRREASLWNAYAEGFKMAADQLVDDIVERRCRPLDMLIYPVVFVYRQYLELRLKELTIASGRLLDEPWEVPKEHNLMRLWAVLRPRMEEVWPDDWCREEMDTVEEKLREFCSFDPGSQGFRYPVDKVRKPSLAGLRYINVRHLKDMMAGISRVIEGASLEMGRYIDIQKEMLGAYCEEAMDWGPRY